MHRAQAALAAELCGCSFICPHSYCYLRSPYGAVVRSLCAAVVLAAGPRPNNLALATRGFADGAVRDLGTSRPDVAPPPLLFRAVATPVLVLLLAESCPLFGRDVKLDALLTRRFRPDPFEGPTFLLVLDAPSLSLWIA